MGDLYAAAMATTVLQLAEIPKRPVSMDGSVCLFGLAKSVDQATIKTALQRYGKIVSCEIGDPAIVRFTTHEAAIATKAAAAELHKGLCDGVDFLYNERDYFERGWCCFEDAVSFELLARLNPKTQALLDRTLSDRPKVFALGADMDPSPIPLEAAPLATRIASITERIESATFTGKRCGMHTLQADLL